MKEYMNEAGEYHRVNGAAREWKDGDYVWYYNDEVHRYYGVAMKWLDGNSYCIFGEEVK